MRKGLPGCFSHVIRAAENYFYTIKSTAECCDETKVMRDSNLASPHHRKRMADAGREKVLRPKKVQRFLPSVLGQGEVPRGHLFARLAWDRGDTYLRCVPAFRCSIPPLPSQHRRPEGPPTFSQLSLSAQSTPTEMSTVADLLSF